MNTFSKNSKIIIFCPPNKVTGGPEALHQLSDKLLKIEIKNVFMHYLPNRKNAKPENYLVYESHEISSVKDDKENVLIIPESMTFLVKKYPESQKIIWWLSVDFYKILMDYRVRKQSFLTKLFYKQKEQEYNFEKDIKVFHWAQSYRSSIYLKEKGVDERFIDLVHEYVNPVYLQNKPQQNLEKNNFVPFNTRKGIKEMELLQKSVPEIEWLPLKDKTYAELSEIMQKSKIFVDFGENPGRDKMLREAVVSDCCIVSGRSGSSAFYEDLMIPDDYKFDFSAEKIPQIISKIKDIIENYQIHLPHFKKYKETVFNEEIEFENKLREIFSE